MRSPRSGVDKADIKPGLDTRQLHQLFDEAPVLMAYAEGPELIFTFVNEAFRKFFDNRPLEGLPVLAAIPEAGAQGFDEILEAVLFSGVAWRGDDVEIRFKGGPTGPRAPRYVDFIYQPVKTEAGSVIGVLCTASDVTERHQVQLEAQRLRHQVLHASRVNAMGTMALTLAHEINQPLAAAANYLAASEYLAKSPNVELPALAEHMALAKAQIVRAGDVIRRVRSFVRNGEADRQPVDLHDALDRVISLLGASGSPTISLTRSIEENAVLVQADAVQLEQVLVNLIRNAAQASGRSERAEAIFKSARTDQGIEISIRDFGSGLPADRLEDLFASSVREDGAGLGVGLSLSRTLIEANGGELRGENADGGGAIFSFNLAAA